MARINLEKTYYLTQIIAVILLIVSVVYVGEQIKLNTQQQRVDAWVGFIDKWYDFSIVSFP